VSKCDDDLYQERVRVATRLFDEFWAADETELVRAGGWSLKDYRDYGIATRPAWWRLGGVGAEHCNTFFVSFAAGTAESDDHWMS
jgi:hypothetical protein